MEPIAKIAQQAVALVPPAVVVLLVILDITSIIILAYHVRLMLLALVELLIVIAVLLEAVIPASRTPLLVLPVHQLAVPETVLVLVSVGAQITTNIGIMDRVMTVHHMHPLVKQDAQGLHSVKHLLTECLMVLAVT